MLGEDPRREKGERLAQRHSIKFLQGKERVDGV